MKLDMAKAYDRLSWSFLFNVLHKFDFGNDVIDIVRRIICNVWYSVLINGTKHEFQDL